MTHRRRSAPFIILVAATLIGALPALGGQQLGDKNLYFGDVHWHSCLSQDAPYTTTLDSQYASMLYDYELDFSMESDHAEGASAGILSCEPYLVFTQDVSMGEALANAMKLAADAWNGSTNLLASAGPISFVTFPGYEWAPDARCWQAGNGDGIAPVANDLNSDDNTPGHINYFFDRTTGWTYHNDVWEPGNGDNNLCGLASLGGFGYYSGSKDWTDEILGQLIHQRDDPNRDYDLMIQYNHPAASIDKGGSSDHLAKWFEFEHSSAPCSVAEDGVPCAQSQCEAVRRAYGVTSVEWYARHEASIGSNGIHPGPEGFDCGGLAPTQTFCYHDAHHSPDRYVSSRGLREGFALAFTGGSDSHGGRRSAPTGFPGGRGAGYGSLTVVQADGPTREAIWDGVTRRRTYALSRFNEIGPVHKGRVDFYTRDLPQFNSPRIDHGMGEHVEASHIGTPRAFTIHAAAETNTTGVYPRELRLYRVGPTTPLSQTTNRGTFWLDDAPANPDDGSKLGELVGLYVNTTHATDVEFAFAIDVFPGDAIFAVVPYSDDVWVDDFFGTDKQPLDADGDGVVDLREDGSPKTGYLHGNNNTWARTTPIFFDARRETARTTSVCATVSFRGSDSIATEDGPGGLDGGLDGDDYVLPVAISDGYDVEWNRYRFTTLKDSAYVDLSFLTVSDDHDPGTLVAVRIDGRLVYSGRGGIDHAQDSLVTKKDIAFAMKRGIHTVEIHSDDQEYAHGDNNPDFHCNDHDGVAAFLDALAFHNEPGVRCSDHTPPNITCPAGITLECNTFGGVSADDPRLVAFLDGAVAVDHIDNAPDIVPAVTTNAPALFPTGTTTVIFTAEDESGNTASCTSSVVVADTTPPELAAFALNPSQIGPPRHDLKTIVVPTLVATDVCDAAPQIRCAITSDEVSNGLGDGDTPVDIVFNGIEVATQGTGPQLISTADGQGTFSLRLRAERSAVGQGRTYTASCLGTDAENNQGTARTATVFVPKCGQGRGRLTGVCASVDVGLKRGSTGIGGVGVVPK